MVKNFRFRDAKAFRRWLREHDYYAYNLRQSPGGIYVWSGSRRGAYSKEGKGYKVKLYGHIVKHRKRAKGFPIHRSR